MEQSIIAIVSFMVEKTSCCNSRVCKCCWYMPFSAVSSGFATSVTMMVAGDLGDALFETGVARVIGIKVGHSSLAKSERTFYLSL